MKKQNVQRISIPKMIMLKWMNGKAKKIGYKMKILEIVKHN